MTTFNDGLNEAINLLSTRQPVYRPGCSWSHLAPCRGPSGAWARAYIAKIETLRQTGGTFEDGLAAAIGVLESLNYRPGLGLVPIDEDGSDQLMSLYTSVLRTILNGDEATP